ncbi:hypothetical protein [Streptosporangium sp. CA-115845]|uniref:hypothetical protein n=1 Tax=Streptosporangium sp. CA-115845 TaxID=3240071 RepID=UPI003D8F9401
MNRSLISTRIANSMVRQLCESLCPSRFFLIVRPSQYDHLLDRYAKRDFVVRGEVGSGDDAAFRGPDVVRRMLETYDRDHAADRTILNDLPERAAEFGFQPVRSFSTTLRHAMDAEPGFGPDEIRLGREEAWSLLSFVRSQRGIEESFLEARDHYFSVECEIGVDIKTQVYRRCP